MSATQSGLPQGPIVDVLWKQLTELNAAIDAANGRWISFQHLRNKIFQLGPSDSVDEAFENESINLKNLQTMLEGLRDTTRRAINEAVRPSLRPLNILDLPDELLRHIFLHVRGRTSMYKLVFHYYLNRGDVKQVKKLRLTCRRFCTTSSHLLMFYVKVNLTSESLALLDKVSRHPTISKGIRAIKICLGRHFDADFSRELPAFAQHHATKLRNSINPWRMSIRHGFSRERTTREVLQNAIDRGTRIAKLCDEAAQHGLDETCPEHVSLGMAQEYYRQNCESQIILQRGPFAQAIVSAMARMPTATWLSIQDEDTEAITESVRKYEMINPQDLESLDTLRPKLQAPSFSWSRARYSGLRSPPIDVIPSILLSIGEAGIPLLGLDLEVPLPDNLSSFSTDQVEPSKLQASSQQLKAFAFRPHHAVALPPEATALLTGFLSTILRTSSLQRIDLCFDFMYKNTGRPQLTARAPSMAHILLSYTWPSLKELSFNGPFCLADLQKVVNHIDKDVELEWSGCLTDASWAEVLDVLRGCGLRTAITLGDTSGSIAGAECVNMSEDEMRLIFRDLIFERHLEPVSRATRYIRGWAAQNPVTEWSNGVLEVPVLDSTDDAETDEDQEGDTISDDET